MKKRKSNQRQHQTAQKEKQESLTLKDALGANILEKLKETQKELKEQEEKEKVKEEERKREERRQREKNKSFEELLNESGMNWKDFK